MNVTAELSIIRGRLASLETRLTDVRGGAGPGGVAAHHLTHEPGGADELTLVTAASDADTVDGQHAAEFLGAGAQAVDSDMVDGSHAAAFQPAGVVPAHHGSHEGAGGGAGADKIKLDDLDTPDDNADLDVTTGHHGLVPKRDGSASKFFSADGTYKTVTAGASNAVKLWTPDAFPAGYAAQCDHFDDASIAAKWTAFQAGGGLSVAESGTHFKYTHTGDNAYQWRGHFQPLPAGDFTIIAKLAFIAPFFNYWSVGLCLFADATNNPNSCALYCFTNEISTGSIQTRITKLNNWQGWAASPKDMLHTTYPVSYLRIRQIGTTIYFDYSIDGLGWINQFSEARWFTPAEMGFILWNYAPATTVYAWFDYFFYKNSADVLPCGVLEEFWIT
jgi:hypothetical protein